MYFQPVRDVVATLIPKVVSFAKQNKRITTIGIIGSCFLLRKVFWYLYHKYYHLPHGPIGLPMIGSLIHLYLQPQLYLTWIKIKYGNISSFYIGNTRIILLNDPLLYKYISTKKEFVNRPFKDKKNQRVIRHVRPLPFINGKEWNVRRKNFFKAMTEMYVFDILIIDPISVYYTYNLRVFGMLQ